MTNRSMRPAIPIADISSQTTTPTSHTYSDALGRTLAKSPTSILAPNYRYAEFEPSLTEMVQASAYDRLREQLPHDRPRPTTTRCRKTRMRSSTLFSSALTAKPKRIATSPRHSLHRPSMRTLVVISLQRRVNLQNRDGQARSAHCHCRRRREEILTCS